MNKKQQQKPPHELRFAILAADVTVFTVREGQLLVRLIPVHVPPHFKHISGVPGGLVRPTETAEQTALRILTTKAGLKANHVHLEQLYTFSAIDRDPRGRVVAVAYLAVVPWELLSSTEQGDTEEAWWEPISRLPKLAYDHREIIRVGKERLQSRVTYTTLIAKLLPREFTLTELERMYESVLGQDIDKRNFRKKIDTLGVLHKLPRLRTGEKHRPAALYAFHQTQVQSIVLF